MKQPLLWSLLLIAATTRLLLHVALMPPYAGLDEIYHVGRVSFVASHQRNPFDHEPSMPRYLERSLARDPRALPVFGALGEEWPREVQRLKHLPEQQALTTTDFATGSTPNYEAQQPSTWYCLQATLWTVLHDPTELSELRLGRLVALFFALVVIVATAFLSTRYFGAAGFVAAALIASLPTWLTLTLRMSNDAICCAFIAVALAVTMSGSRSAAAIALEAIAWAGAAATKLYSWPLFIVPLFAWYWQRAPKRRVLGVTSTMAVAVLLTMLDLRARTSNPLGLFAFDPAHGHSAALPIDYGSMFRIFIASGIWTSGQHWNALRPLGMFLYVAPLLLVVLIEWLARRREVALSVRRPIALTAIAFVSFIAAQGVNAAGYIRQAHASGSSLPAGGKEGWYLYAVVPLFAGVVLARVLAYSPRMLAWFAAAWLVVCDVIIHEGALYRDWAGLTSPLHPNALFRWGAAIPGSIYHAPLAAGPLVSAALWLRAIHVIAFVGLCCVALPRNQAPAPQA